MRAETRLAFGTIAVAGALVACGSSAKEFDGDYSPIPTPTQTIRVQPYVESDSALADPKVCDGTVQDGEIFRKKNQFQIAQFGPKEVMVCDLSKKGLLQVGLQGITHSQFNDIAKALQSLKCAPPVPPGDMRPYATPEKPVAGEPQIVRRMAIGVVDASCVQNTPSTPIKTA